MMDRCKEEKTFEINKQTSVRKEQRTRGWKCEDGQGCVLMLTGPLATTEHATCNNRGGLNHGGRAGRHGGGANYSHQSDMYQIADRRVV